jgi:uncharacterized protein YcgI (DUF1989 family)
MLLKQPLTKIFIINKRTLVSNLKLVSNHHSDLVCWNDLVSKNLCKQGRKEAKKHSSLRVFLNGPLWHLWGDFREC